MRRPRRSATGSFASLVITCDELIGLVLEVVVHGAAPKAERPEKLDIPGCHSRTRPVRAVS
jgi:hypothetical protein